MHMQYEESDEEGAARDREVPPVLRRCQTHVFVSKFLGPIWRFAGGDNLAVALCRLADRVVRCSLRRVLGSLFFSGVSEFFLGSSGSPVWRPSAAPGCDSSGSQ